MYFRNNRLICQKQMVLVRLKYLCGWLFTVVGELWMIWNEMQKTWKKIVCLELFICNAVGKLEYLFCMFETTIRTDDVSNKNLFHFHFLKTAAVYWRIFARFGQNVLACARFKVKQVTTGDTKYQKKWNIVYKTMHAIKVFCALFIIVRHEWIVFPFAFWMHIFPKLWHSVKSVTDPVTLDTNIAHRFYAYRIIWKAKVPIVCLFFFVDNDD